MLLLDITIVNVALPKIATDLKANFSDIQWVIDAYALTLASLLLTTGTLADLFGRRLLFSIGLALFAFTSLLCALSPSALFLILARAAQGVGGAIMFSTSLALLAQEFHGRERGTALGIWGATIGGATAVGPLLGGILTQAFGWSSIFYINVPIGLVAAFLTMTKVNESRNPDARSVDWIGTVTFTGGPVPARPRCDPRQRRGLGQRADRQPVRRIGPAAGGVRDRRDRPGQRDVRPDAVPQADLRRRIDRRVHALVLDVRDVPLPDAVPADDPGVVPAADGSAISAGDSRRVRGLGGVGQPVDASARPAAARRRPRARRRRAAADARPFG